ncbi:hypothetical protein P7K49_027064, partial [Saguinus oedipus]
PFRDAAYVHCGNAGGKPGTSVGAGGQCGARECSHRHVPADSGCSEEGPAAWPGLERLPGREQPAFSSRMSWSRPRAQERSDGTVPSR